MTEPTRYLTVAGAARYLSLSEKALYHRVARRTVPFIKHGARVMFDVKRLDRWMQQGAVDAARRPVIDSAGPDEPRRKDA